MIYQENKYVNSMYLQPTDKYDFASVKNAIKNSNSLDAYGINIEILKDSKFDIQCAGLLDQSIFYYTNLTWTSYAITISGSLVLESNTISAAKTIINDIITKLNNNELT